MVITANLVRGFERKREPLAHLGLFDLLWLLRFIRVIRDPRVTGVSRLIRVIRALRVTGILG
jgi:hypothetical protein